MIDNKTDKKLTAVISFLNEGEEVRRTVESILEFSEDNVDIIVINDGSHTLYDYEEMLKPFENVTYFRNEKRLGVATCRDMGVELAKTPYFILLDSHMRFYKTGWVDKIVNLLEEDDRRIFCCQTKALEKDESEEVVPKKAKTVFGARINLTDDEIMVDPKWISDRNHDPDSDVVDIPCVLGASYSSSKRYWKYLRGYEGLRLYGYEEPYISMKAWLEGGRCCLIKDIEVGHIYRRRSPYRIAYDEPMYNRMLIATLLLPEDLRQRVFENCRKRDEKTFGIASKLLEDNKQKIEELRKYYQTIFRRDFDFIKQLNDIGSKQFST